jgi:hypothetical protein
LGVFSFHDAVIFFRKYAVEIFAVFLLAIILEGAYFISTSLAFSPADIFEFMEQQYSIQHNALEFFSAFLPFIPAIAGGYLVSKKSRKGLAVFIVPAIALLFAGMIISVVQLGYYFPVSEAEWENGYNMEITANFLDISMEQFKIVTFAQASLVVLGTVFSFVGIGFAGGLASYLLFYNKK